MVQGFALRPEVYINNLDGKNRKISIPVCIAIQPEVHILYALPVAMQHSANPPSYYKPTLM